MIPARRSHRKRPGLRERQSERDRPPEQHESDRAEEEPGPVLAAAPTALGIRDARAQHLRAQAHRAPPRARPGPRRAAAGTRSATIATHSERRQAAQQVILGLVPGSGAMNESTAACSASDRRRTREDEHVHPCRSEPPRAQRCGSAERPGRASRRDHLLASKPDGQHAQLAPVFRSHERRPSRKSRICGVTNYASGSGSADLDRRHARMELPDEAPSGGRG